MATKRKKKHPHLPNGFGAIRYLGPNRANCYAVHPPARADADGHMIRPPALCYVQSWYAGMAVLTAYKAGTYKPGLEYDIQTAVDQSDESALDPFCDLVLHNLSLAVQPHVNPGESQATFKEVYRMWYDWKYGSSASKKLSEATKAKTEAAFQHFASLHGRVLRTITLDELQAAVNAIPGKTATLARDKTLLNQMYKFAVPRKLCSEDISRYVVVPDRGETKHGTPFTQDDIVRIWALRSTDPTAEIALIMIYSGFRFAAYPDLEINLTDWYFKGGVKTKAGKGRIVPIHTCIRPLVVQRLARGDTLAPFISSWQLIREFDKLAKTAGVEAHTAHDCRHTFSMLCEKYKVSEADRKRMMGHSFGADVTNGVYGHRTLEDLREELEKIPSPDNF